jgi:glutamyl-tRNA reductase
MDLLVVGLSHHTAPVDVREKVALPDGALDEALRGALATAAVGGAAVPEAMVLSTCNRVEVYLAGSDAAAMRARICGWLAAERRFDPAALDRHLYALGGEGAVRHLFRVAASLDSAVVGEPQILGQLKDAFEAAVRAGAVGPVLGRVVPRAFAAAKRVRTETGLGRAPASVASAAVGLGRRIFGELHGREVLVVGAGKMGRLAARHLVAAGCGRLLVVNRTLARAQALVEELREAAPAEAHPWEELGALLARADIVLCSTGAAEPVITRALVHRAMKARKGRWLCLLDIAVPRDVEPAAGDEENVYLYDVDELTRVVDGHLAERRREAEAAERLVTEELVRLGVAESARGVVPTIKGLREHFAAVARAEAQRTLGRLQGLSERDRREVQALADAIVNKLLHQPLTALKREAESEALVTAVRTLFPLADAVEAAPEPPRVEQPAAARAAGAAGGSEDPPR